MCGRFTAAGQDVIEGPVEWQAVRRGPEAQQVGWSENAGAYGSSRAPSLRQINDGPSCLFPLFRPVQFSPPDLLDSIMAQDDRVWHTNIGMNKDSP